MKKFMLGVFVGFLLVVSISFVLAEIACSTNDDCGDVTVTYPRCRNTTNICSVTRTPTCYNATTNTSYCEDVEVDDCYVCENGCESGACKQEESCGENNLGLCLNKNDCGDADGKWKNGSCEVNNGEDHEDDNETESNETESNETESGIGLGQTIRNQVHAGVYTSPRGEQIRVRELAQNRYLLNYNNDSINASTELEIEEETQNNQTKLKARLSNGRNAEIKIMPGVAAEKALERLRLKVCSESNNCSIELKEVGKGEGNKTRAAYEIQIQRHERLLGMFKIKAQNRIQIDAETGDILSVKKPWWSFLASDVEE